MIASNGVDGFIYLSLRCCSQDFFPMPPLSIIQTGSLRQLEVSVERLTGKTVNDLRQFSIEDYRLELETRHKRPLRFVSRFPFIGRGNVMRDRIINSAKIEKQLDAMLR